MTNQKPARKIRAGFLYVVDFSYQETYNHSKGDDRI